MQRERDFLPYRDNELNLDNVIVGRRMQRAIMGEKLRVLGEQVVGSFQNYTTAISFASMGGLRISSQLRNHMLNDSPPAQRLTIIGSEERIT